MINLMSNTHLMIQLSICCAVVGGARYQLLEGLEYDDKIHVVSTRLNVIFEKLRPWLMNILLAYYVRLGGRKSARA